MNMDINLQQIPIETIELRDNFWIDIMRLDALHPQISGNKYFKLIKNIDEAIKGGFKQIVTLGGAYSNHLHATAFLCNQYGLKSVGVVRGQSTSNETMEDCAKWGMEFCFTDYLNWVNLNYKQLLENIKQQYPDAYYIPMGGDNLLGVEGFSLLQNQLQDYGTIICSVGTGTTLAGLRKHTQAHQQVIGVQAVIDKNVKGNIAYKSGLDQFVLIDNYTFGGFAKYDRNLIDFMKYIYKYFKLPLDFVYTAKTLYALYLGDLDKHIVPNQKVLFVHTGGLQGNRGIDVFRNMY
jgi:1-aminocyclopropane-1-carboxylate deaminase